MPGGWNRDAPRFLESLKAPRTRLVHAGDVGCLHRRRVEWPSPRATLQGLPHRCHRRQPAPLRGGTPATRAPAPPPAGRGCLSGDTGVHLDSRSIPAAACDLVPAVGDSQVSGEVGGRQRARKRALSWRPGREHSSTPRPDPTSVWSTWRRKCRWPWSSGRGGPSGLNGEDTFVSIPPTLAILVLVAIRKRPAVAIGNDHLGETVVIVIWLTPCSAAFV
jgi:hypothetical protein